MRTEVKYVELRKYFVTCPDCGQERQVNGHPLMDTRCEKCSHLSDVAISKESFITSSRMFEKLKSDIDGDFEFDDEKSYDWKSCCLTDKFTLIGKSGAQYKFTTYDDFLELESIDE